jgi:hypothetical protein
VPTAAQILARARVGCRQGELQSSRNGVRDPAHYRELLAEEARDNAEALASTGARLAALEKENAELRAAAGPILRLRAEVARMPISWVDRLGRKEL